MDSGNSEGAKAGPAERPMTSAARMNQKGREEFQERRKKHARKLSNKLGKTFERLESSLPEQFLPKEKTREAILEQTRRYAKTMETQLNAAPSTALCLICDKPRIACGCQLPEYLRQPMEQVDRRMEEYFRNKGRQMAWRGRKAGSDLDGELSE